MVMPGWALLVTSMLLQFTSAQDTEFSRFALYKNTHFGPCPTSVPVNATVPTPDKEGDGLFSLINNPSLSSDAFCNQFWNYTVLPSTPAAGAFSFSWTNSLVNNVICPLYLIAAVNVEEKVWYAEWHHMTPLVDDVLSGPTNHKHFRAQYQKAGFLARAKNILWWPLFVYAAVEMVLWWISFQIILAHPRESHPMLSPLASLVTVAITLNWYIDLQEEWFKRLSWPVIITGLLQLLASGVALGLFYLFHSTADQYRIHPDFDLTPFI